MAHPIVMPKAGQSMTEGKIVAWLKKEGDAVKQGEPILEIETDKANLEVEAQDEGILRKILVRQGESCPVLTLIGVIGAAGEKIDMDELKKSMPKADESGGGMEVASSAPAAVAAAPASQKPAPAPSAPKPATAAPPRWAPAPFPQPLAPAASVRGRVFASPLARKVAKDRGIDLSRLRGSGPGGRILRRDVEGAPATAATGRTDGAGMVQAPLAGALGEGAKPYPPPSPRPPAKVPVEGMRKAIGTALQQSKQTIPHFYATISVDASAALALKKSREAEGAKVSINDIIVRASAIALEEEPRVNCRVFADRIEYPEDVNIGVAVGQEEGLVVPVILRAQTRDLAGIAAETKRIVAAANSGKLIGSGQGTFTVSNLGMFGVELFTAIINPPEGAILAVGALTTEVVPFCGGFLPRSVIRMTLSCDHRAVDGVLAARFLARVKHLIENPERL